MVDNLIKPIAKRANKCKLNWKGILPEKANLNSGNSKKNDFGGDIFW